MTFDYDEVKAALNPIKHEGVTFEEAKSLFFTHLSLIIPDERHSDDERRELIVGPSSAGRILLVSYVDRTPPSSNASAIRIISARKATAKERKRYEEFTR